VRLLREAQAPFRLASAAEKVGAAVVAARFLEHPNPTVPFRNMKQKTLYLSSSFFVWGRGMSSGIRMFPSKNAPSSMAMRGV
jgi:hypothetical protein